MFTNNYKVANVVVPRALQQVQGQPVPPLLLLAVVVVEVPLAVRPVTMQPL
jgi:hypothetical protein